MKFYQCILCPMSPEASGSFWRPLDVLVLDWVSESTVLVSVSSLTESRVWVSVSVFDS